MRLEWEGIIPGRVSPYLESEVPGTLVCKKRVGHTRNPANRAEGGPTGLLTLEGKLTLETKEGGGPVVGVYVLADRPSRGWAEIAPRSRSPPSS